MGKKGMVVVLGICLTLLTLVLTSSKGEGTASLKQDKAFAEKMIRFGKEAYLRGRYIEAKSYFRKALEADPSSEYAWTFYDISSIAALAKRVEKETKLLATQDVPTEGEPSQPAVPAAKPTPSPEPPASKPEAKDTPTKPKEEKIEFKIIQDEGC